MKITAFVFRSCGPVAILTLAAQAAIAQDIYVYPAAGQTDAQLADDRYACHLWAVNESGFDPTQYHDIAPPRTVKVPVGKNEAEGATGKGALAGAVAGGIIGAHDGEVAQGAVIGAVVGSVAGAAIEEKGSREARARARDEAQDKAREIERSKAELALRKSNYRRARTACMEGRGYTVR